MLSLSTLPESLIPRALDVLRVLSTSERDLIRLVVEIINELRDSVEAEAELGIADAEEPGEEDSVTFISPSTISLANKFPCRWQTLNLINLGRHHQPKRKLQLQLAN